MYCHASSIERNDTCWRYYNVRFMSDILKAFKKRSFTRARLAREKNMTGRSINKLGCSREKIFHRDKLLRHFEFAKKPSLSNLRQGFSQNE